ncbi:MAG: hypothetical protein KDF65_12440, partial [Anaerolineae bacterium]|nr:hypothetical protein [Anaerolineae bacterium]
MITKRHSPTARKNTFIITIKLIGLFATLVGLSLIFLTTRPAHAQIDAFTYFIPYPRDILDDQFDIG